MQIMLYHVDERVQISSVVFFSFIILRGMLKNIRGLHG